MRLSQNNCQGGQAHPLLAGRWTVGFCKSPETEEVLGAAGVHATYRTFDINDSALEEYLGAEIPLLSHRQVIGVEHFPE